MRTPRPDELPDNPEVHERIKAMEKANIVEGYTLQENADIDLPFKFYAEINIDNSRLWDLIKAILQLMPDEVSVIYNRFEAEANYSPYLRKRQVRELLSKYKTEICQDCNLEFGIIHHTEEGLEELFVSESKYVKFWGCTEAPFRTLLAEMNLKEIPGLNFADEFPKVVEPLAGINPLVRATDVLLLEWQAFFDATE
ncbi:MAG: hypothetical protein ACHQRM_05845 [Bacteroidia bacterium]